MQHHKPSSHGYVGATTAHHHHHLLFLISSKWHHFTIEWLDVALSSFLPSFLPANEHKFVSPLTRDFEGENADPTEIA
jgi:hypothetical protein